MVKAAPQERLGVSGDLNIDMTKLFGGNARAGIKDLNAKNLSVGTDVHQKTIFEFKRLFHFSGLKLYVQGVSFLIKVYLHIILNLLKPVSGQDQSNAGTFFVNNLKCLTSKIFLSNHTTFKTWNNPIGMLNGLFNMARREVTLVNPSLSVVRVDQSHETDDNIFSGKLQAALSAARLQDDGRVWK